MPLIAHSTYRAPHWCINKHVQTIYPSLFRNTPALPYQRERLLTPDNDFFDIDWAKVGSRAVVIVLHGLEGNAHRPYVQWMIRKFNEAGIDGIGFNFRGCSGETNWTQRKYHSGDSTDLTQLVDTLQARGCYESIYLVGFSLGGNVLLKYLGEQGQRLSSLIKKAVAFSTTLNVKDCVTRLANWRNRHYTVMFIKDLAKKLHLKKDIYQDAIDYSKLSLRMTLADYDNFLTAPMHGFKDADDYYAQCSAGQFLPHITIPTLLVNALNDPFLGRDSFPVQTVSALANVFLETPRQGGHVGFVTRTRNGFYWSEERALSFCQQP